MQLTLQSDYSLRVLMYLAEKDTRSTVREIAEHYSISHHHLVKVVHQLGRLGYLSTQQGKGGGIALARAPAEISVAEVIRKTEPLALVECFDAATNTCPRAGSACKLKGALAEAQWAFFKSLEKHTLASLVSSGRPASNCA